jgi:AraC family transcriptional regulator
LCEQQQKQEGRLTAKHIHTIKGYLSGLTTKAASVADLAAACGYSERHFAKLFREQYGCSVSSYLKAVQISRAKAYLLSTDLHLKEIAHKLGFSSLAHFSHTFREVTGETPGQFRRAE